ncbi:MAG TPA: hypothetical protein ENJ18_02450 [Nannocystis exedens]|nr:hypothetical protein [Nannocystis exedens]
MLLALPNFQFRFMAAMGNVIFPANFHPVGSQRAGENLVSRALEHRRWTSPGEGGRWLVIGGSGGFGSAARSVLGATMGAHTLSISLDGQPQPESRNKIRKIGSPGFHRNLAIERHLRGLDLITLSHNADAFAPKTLDAAIKAIKEDLGGPLDGIIWALAAPRAIDPRSGKAVVSALKPLGHPVTIKTFGNRSKAGESPAVMEFEIAPGNPEEAVATQFVMGGGIVNTWMRALLEAGMLAQGCRLLTISYRGNPLNAGIYREGLIGLAKADLEFHTKALDALLSRDIGGRALAVEGPAVVTEASGGIPGVPFYMALLLEVLGERFEDPLASMLRMFTDKLPSEGEPQVDDDGLLRMDDRELDETVQIEMSTHFRGHSPGDAFDDALFDRFLREYARTRGFAIEGVDYSAEFDTIQVCQT